MPPATADFARVDEADDAHMYAAPRLVAHLDAPARDALTAAYRCLLSGFAHAHHNSVLPSGAGTNAAPAVAVLDTCSSWLSHLPDDALPPPDSRVVVQGLNLAELDANQQATERLVCDLNRRPALPFTDGSFDLVTNVSRPARRRPRYLCIPTCHPAHPACSPMRPSPQPCASQVSSVDYLTQPREVFAEVHRVLRPGGCVAVAFSNRCFESKAVALWMRKVADGAALAEVVCNYVHFGAPDGWAHISCADISPSSDSGDPLWLVVATKK